MSELSFNAFVDLSNGWFFALDTDWAMIDDACPVAQIVDADSISPDVFFGPAAWAGNAGPGEGQVLLEVRNSQLDDYLNEHESTSTITRPKTPFPGRVSVTKAGEAVGLGVLHGFNVESIDSFYAMIQPMIQTKTVTGLGVTSADERLDSFRKRRPEVFTS